AGPVQKKLALADDAVGAAHPVQQVEESNDLTHVQRSPSLLAVAECRVRNKNLVGWIDRDFGAVEEHLRGIQVRELIAHQVGLSDVRDGDGPVPASERPATLHGGLRGTTLMSVLSVSYGPGGCNIHSAPGKVGRAVITPSDDLRSSRGEGLR